MRVILIAIGAMIATERYADGRILTLARHFRESRLLSDEGLSAFRAELGVADRRSSSALAEGIILVAALAWSSVTVPSPPHSRGRAGRGRWWPARVSLSWAGEATRFLSNPLFLFLACVGSGGSSYGPFCCTASPGCRSSSRPCIRTVPRGSAS